MKNTHIIICPGHGKSTPGKRSPDSSFFEWKFNRELSKILADKLKEYGYLISFAVNPDDETDYSLTTRYKKANQLIVSHPECRSLFIEIHGNAAGDGSSWMNGRGYEVYTTVGQNNSDRLAECILNAAEEMLPQFGIKIRKDTSDGDKDKEKNFTVIYNVKCPAVLIENLFYDNKEDLKILKSEWGKDILTDVIVNGIIDYLK